MANNRLYLKCEDCKEEILICKYYPSSGYYRHHPIGKIDEWLAKHSHCDGNMLWGNKLTTYLEIEDE